MSTGVCSNQTHLGVEAVKNTAVPLTAQPMNPFVKTPQAAGGTTALPQA